MIMFRIHIARTWSESFTNAFHHRVFPVQEIVDWQPGEELMITVRDSQGFFLHRISVDHF